MIFTIIILFIFITGLIIVRLFIFYRRHYATRKEPHFEPAARYDTLVPRFDLSHLNEGYLQLDCPSSMRLGKTVPVTAEIFEDINFLELFDSKKMEVIKVGEEMKLKLMGSDFKIQSKNTSFQFILPSSKTTWKWDVKPLKHGIKDLALLITVKLTLRHREGSFDYPILNKEILVKINRSYIVQEFWNAHWKWIISTVVGSGIAVTILEFLGVLPE